MAHALDPRFDAALQAFDALESDGPSGPDGTPEAVRYGHRMLAWLARGWPDASDVLRLAVRAQHLGRYRLPRSTYPDGRDGYRAWRKAAARLHADLAGEVLRRVGYDDALAQRVGEIIRKERFKQDPEAQALEDVACLVFLEFELEAFAQRVDEDKMVAILRKTWPKLSDQGRALALQLPLGPEPARLVARALEGA